jgi:hypothetical protein
MTDKPNTLALNARQWRVLMNDHLEVLKAVVASAEVLDDAGLKNVMRHLDEVRLMAGAWYQNSPPPAPAADVQAAADVAQDTQTNDAAPKRRGGWPAGKPRKQRLNPAQVQ